jgi:hypothetical protein
MPQKAEYFDSDISMINHTANDREPVDEEHEVLLSSYYKEAEEETWQQIISKPYFPRGCNISVEQLEALVIEDNTDTAWETELREHRMMRWASVLKYYAATWQPKHPIQNFRFSWQCEFSGLLGLWCSGSTRIAQKTTT